MITPSSLRHTVPRHHFYGHMRDYHRARPGHDSRPQGIVTGIQEEDSRSVPGDLLAEWDILFYPRTTDPAERVLGDVVARRALRRARHSRTSVKDSDSHPVILLAADVPITEARERWQQILRTAEHGVTLADVLLDTETEPS